MSLISTINSQTNTLNTHPSSSPRSSPSTSPSLPASRRSSPTPHPPVPSPPSSFPSPSPSPHHSSPPSPSASPGAYPRPTWDGFPPCTPSHRDRTPLSRTYTSGDGYGFWHNADRVGRSHGCSADTREGRRRGPDGGRGSPRRSGRKACGCSACSRACGV